MQIPVKVSLLGQRSALPLTLEGENAQGPDERVLEFDKPEHTFKFVGVAEAPLLSLGRGFSAPVHFKTAADRRARATLMRRDSDDFNRWEAGQSLSMELMIEMANAARGGATPIADRVYIDALADVFAVADRDPAFAALMLSPPLESEMALAMAKPDPEAIHAARVSLVRQIAAAHGGTIEALYRRGESAKSFTPDAKSAGQRSLRNACLRFLTASDDEGAAELAEAHYRKAGNMTDMIAGLAALSRMDSGRRDHAFADFHDRFRDNPLVLDKWLSLQAGSSLPGTANAVRALMKHRAFDIRNPNRVRSLLGAFSGNHLRFHSADGSGYSLLGEAIRELDKINPQLAARTAGCFESWHRYDARRQALMRGELGTMARMEGLSSNLFEVATKMLG
jgi:aminopeptidase N